MLRRSPKVFISYRRQDSPGHAGRLAADLIREFGARNVFIDIDAIEVGSDFIEAIENAINSTDVLIVLIGKDWLKLAHEAARERSAQEDFVRVEIGAGLRRNIRVIPVLVEGAKMPLQQDLPNDLKSLSRRNAIEISDQRWRHDVEHLIDAIKKASRLKAEGPSTGNPSATRGAGRGVRAESVFSKVNVGRVVLLSLALLSLAGAPWALRWVMRRGGPARAQQDVNLNLAHPSPDIAAPVARPPAQTPMPTPAPTPAPNIRELDAAAFAFPKHTDFGEFTPDEKVIYGDLTGDGQAEAVFTGMYSDPSPHSRIYTLKGFVYTLKDGRPELLAQFSAWEPDSSPMWGSVSIKDEVLTVRSANHIASDSMDVISYKWNGSRLVLVSERQISREP